MIPVVLIVIIGAVLVTLCLLRLRIHFELSPDRRWLFLGVGRSGAEFDYVRKRRSIKLFGVRIKSSAITMNKTDQPAERKRPPDTDKKPGRRGSWQDILCILPKCSGPLWAYTVGLLRSIIVEKLETEIKAGFDAPDLTGQIYGYYQATLAAVPSFAGRLCYTPDWTGASFSGRARVAVALPVYRLIYRSTLLVCRLPLRELIKLAIGKKKGDQDGKQRS
ncbi:MAG: hypothetical protein U9R56_00105 [candidate division Zixibacteria bacterium]|nr:hypothetical protein [candidate division Zixibacteria bacterium]